MGAAGFIGLNFVGFPEVEAIEGVGALAAGGSILYTGARVAEAAESADFRATLIEGAAADSFVVPATVAARVGFCGAVAGGGLGYALVSPSCQ